MIVRAAIYKLETGEITGHIETLAPMIADQCGPGEEFFLNCPRWATHIVDGQPVKIDPPAPARTPEERAAAYAVEVQRHLDREARGRGYDNIVSACSYATSTVDKFRLEGQAYVEWRDKVWIAFYGILEEINSSARPEVTAAELAGLLPAMVWTS